MRILYLAPIRLPAERAHGKQIMKTCEALASQGHEITLVHPSRRLEYPGDPFSYYGIRRRFSLIKVSSGWDRLAHGKFGFLLAVLFFFLAAVRASGRAYDVVYTRTDWLAYVASFWFSRVVWEIHEARTGFLARRLTRRSNVRAIAITRGIFDAQHEAGLRFAKELVVADAVDLSEEPVSVDRARKLKEEIGLARDARVLLYAGSIGLYPWKGVDLLIEMAKVVPAPWRILILGGDEGQIRAWQEKTGDTRCLWHPAVPPTEVGAWYALADAFALPNRAGDRTSERFTSPMKLFEYLGEGKPILASRLPSIEEVVTAKEVWFMDPSDPLGDAARFFAMADTSEWTALGTASRAKAAEYTWTKRAQRISAFLT